MTEAKLVSVLMPVYNGQDYLREAIESILWQTYANFELIIIDDGSVDSSRAIIKDYSDPRIVYVEQANMGSPQTLNKGLSMARGEFIARQDHDDISDPERLRRQVDFLERCGDVGLVGTWSKIIVDGDLVSRVHRHPVDDQELQFELLFGNPFVHSSVMLRKEVFDRIGGYATDRRRQPPDDYELWSRVARNYRIANIPEYLVQYREVSSSISRTRSFISQMQVIAGENMAYWVGVGPDYSDLSSHIMDVMQLSPGIGFDLGRFRRSRGLIASAHAAIYGEHADAAARQVLRKRLQLYSMKAMLCGMLSSSALGTLTRLAVSLKRKFV